MKSIAIIPNIIIFIVSVQCASKYYDGENRPYEFGFNIDGNQHRQEKKDANGIIMGEYGFLTADQIYHITKYATDENGNFKILSMENININKLKELRAQAMAKNAAPLTSTSIIPLTTIPTTTPIPLLRIVASTIIPKQYTPPKTLDIPSCSNCRIPAPVVESMLEYLEEKTNDNPSPAPPSPPSPQSPPENNNYDKINDEPIDTMARFGTQSNTHESEEIINNPEANQEPQQYQNQPSAYNLNQQNSDYMNNKNNEEKYPQNEISQDPNHNGETVPSNEDINNNRDYNNNNHNNNNNNINNYDNNNLNNNHNIIRNDEMQKLLTGLLYRFNYTVGFHGHHEEGDASGSKKGSYFVTGRDGIKRIVNYTADESGFHPIIEEEMVSGDEIPNEASEREAGLKGYEFKWFN